MGQGISLRDTIREEKRRIRRHERALDREVSRLQKERDVLTYKIRAQAKAGGDRAMLEALSSEYLISKRNSVRLMQTKMQTSALVQKLDMMTSRAEITRAVQGLTIAIKRMNDQLRSSDIGRIIGDFHEATMENEVHGQEMEVALGDDDEIDPEERDQIVEQVLEELGVETMTRAPDAYMTPRETGAGSTHRNRHA